MKRLERDLPTVLMSIETATRELDSKLVLAAALADRGCRAIVAHKESAHEIARHSRRVIWLGKSVFNRKHERTSLVLDLIRNESPLIYHHDEGGIYPEKIWETCVLRSHPPELFAQGSYAKVCTWGKKQAALLSARVPTLNGTFTVTGSPRFDVCAPKFAWIDSTYESQSRSRYLPYILVNTRFPAVMHAEGPTFGFLHEMLPVAWPSWMSPHEVRDLWYSKWSQDARDLASFLVLIKELAVANPKFTIVVRPHPSESVEFYEVALGPLENVVVIQDGSVVSWIRSASLVVHCKCTTGVEAAIAGRPVLHFWPDRERDTGRGETVAREAGVTVGTIGEALEKAAGLLNGVLHPQTWSPPALEMLNNLVRPATPLLVEETLNVMNERAIDSSDVRVPPRPRRFRPMGFLRRKLRPRQPSYVESKRGRMDPTRIAGVVRGCQEFYRGARLKAVTDRYAIVEPA
ncbi:MAG: surface carbohydrate biosynthesis protein [Gemmatimonadota bacterium]